MKDFISSQNLDLINSKGKTIIVKAGEKIPDEFIPSFLLHNRNFIANLEYKNSIPSLSVEQEKKYGVSFKPPEAAPLKIKYNKYTQEKLTNKLNNLGAEKFKVWAENKFGDDEIDRRKSAKSIIVQILKIQEEAKR